MPKIKTRRATAKRFKLTATGRLKRSCANKSHILTKKTRKRKRNLRKGGLVNAANANQVKRQLPYL